MSFHFSLMYKETQQLDGLGLNQNKVKVLVNANVFEDRGGVGFGMVARNSEWDLIEARSSLGVAADS